MCKINNTSLVLPILALHSLFFFFLFFFFCFLKNIDSVGSIVDMMWSPKALSVKKKGSQILTNRVISFFVMILIKPKY